MYSNRRGIEAFELAVCLSFIIVFIIALIPNIEPHEDFKIKHNVNTTTPNKIEEKEGEKMIKKTDARYVAVLCVVATKLTEKEWDDLFFLKLDDNSGGYQFKLGNKFINLYYDEENDNLYLKYDENHHIPSKIDRYETSATFIVKYLKEN